MQRDVTQVPPLHDATAPEYDAPPPANANGPLPVSHPNLYPRRPASRVVDLASRKPDVIVKG